MHSIEDDQGNVHIYWGCKRYYSFNRSNSFERRLGVALLAKLGVLRRTITELFDVTRHTALNILRVYESRGAEGLLDYKQGPTPVGEELKAFVIKKYVELDGKRGYQNCILGAIEKKVGEGIFGKVISRSKLQQIIRGHKWFGQSCLTNAANPIRPQSREMSDPEVRWYQAETGGSQGSICARITSRSSLFLISSLFSECLTSSLSCLKNSLTISMKLCKAIAPEIESLK